MGLTRKMGISEVAERVRQHGGVLEALEWGLRSSRIEDPELAAMWTEIEASYDAMRPRLLEAGRVLRAERRAA